MQKEACSKPPREPISQVSYALASSSFRDLSKGFVLCVDLFFITEKVGDQMLPNSYSKEEHGP